MCTIDRKCQLMLSFACLLQIRFATSLFACARTLVCICQSPRQIKSTAFLPSAVSLRYLTSDLLVSSYFVLANVAALLAVARRSLQSRQIELGADESAESLSGATSDCSNGFSQEIRNRFSILAHQVMRTCTPHNQQQGET